MNPTVDIPIFVNDAAIETILAVVAVNIPIVDAVETKLVIVPLVAFNVAIVETPVIF